jgi:hypothetical protein
VEYAAQGKPLTQSRKRRKDISDFRLMRKCGKVTELLCCGLGPALLDMLEDCPDISKDRTFK